jgi:hypothetical protein
MGTQAFTASGFSSKDGMALPIARLVAKKRRCCQLE